MSRKYTLADLHVRLTGAAMVEICNRISARDAALRAALGVPEGLEIPPKPIPPTKEDCLAEIAELTELQREAYQTRMSLPPGPECESAGFAMVYYRDRRIWLACAIRDGEVV
jgi:hypothetical protein